MNSVKILHTADLHLGIDRMSLNSKSKARRAEVRRTFHSILQLALKEKVELLLIAGDLFDTVNVSEEIITEVRDSLAELAPVCVAICSGNHDPATPDSPYRRENFWPENVYMFLSEMQICELPGLGVRLLGAGFSGAYSTQPMLRRCALPEDDYINIGIMHGELVADGSGSEYNPISVRQIEASGLQYLALGHIHKRSLPDRAGRTTFAYSGCPEGQRFGEDGVQGVYIAEVSKEACDIVFVPTCARRYTTLSVDISRAESRAEVRAMIEAAMRNENGEDYAEQIYRIVLTGEPEGDFIESLEELKYSLSEIWYMELKDHTRPHVAEEELVTENSLRGIFVKQMLDMRGKIPEEKREMALRLGLKAFYGPIETDE